jgi:hypothetical protein
MAKKQTPAQKRTVERVMHEFKHGDLGSRGGREVKEPKQAIAIALHEAGASEFDSAEENRRAFRKTKTKERRGGTGMDQAERPRRLAQDYRRRQRKDALGEGKERRRQRQVENRALCGGEEARHSGPLQDGQGGAGARASRLDLQAIAFRAGGWPAPFWRSPPASC